MLGGAGELVIRACVVVRDPVDEVRCVLDLVIRKKRTSPLKTLHVCSKRVMVVNAQKNG